MYWPAYRASKPHVYVFIIRYPGYKQGHVVTWCSVLGWCLHLVRLAFKIGVVQRPRSREPHPTSLESAYCGRDGEHTVNKPLNPAKITGTLWTTTAAAAVLTCAVYLEGNPPRKTAKPLPVPGRIMSYVAICEQRHCCTLVVAHHTHAALTAATVDARYSRPSAVGSGFTHPAPVSHYHSPYNLARLRRRFHPHHIVSRLSLQPRATTPS